MIFSDEEIKILFYCRKIAEVLNSSLPNETKELLMSNGKKIKINNVALFDQLKKIIFKIDDLLKKIFGNDLSEEKSRFIINYFDNFSLSSFYEVSSDNKNIGIKYYVWDFYKFIYEFFRITYLFRNVGDSATLDEIDSILNELHNVNQRYGLNTLENNDKLYDRVVLIEDEIKRLYKELNISSAQIKETVDGFVLTQQDYFNDQLNSLIDSLRSSLGSIHNKYENEVKGKVENLETLINQTDQDFKSTFNDYNQLKGLVNIKGEMLITDHYKKRAFWERITYWAMTIATFIIIILSICLALNGLNEYKEKTDVPVTTLIENYKDQPIEKIEKIYSAAQENALIYLVLRLIFSVLLFSSIIYTSRVAYRAYVHMRHSENMMLKLATLRPFINQLKEDERNQIHKDLVPDYFGKDAGMVDSTNEKFKDLPANVSAVAMKAIEQISGNGSNSSTEKNNKKPESETG